VTLRGNGFTLVEPDLSSTATELPSQHSFAITNSAAANTARGSLFNQDFNDLSLLPDQQDQSRVEIVTGGSVEFQNGSDTSAPGGQIAVSAVNRVQADGGALVDVSGSYAVPMAMSSNDLAVNIQSFELRDNPQNRLTELLRSNTVNVDARQLSLVPASAAYPTNRDYTKGGLLEVSGYLANVGHQIGEFTAIGGSIDLSTGSSGAIVAQSGAVFGINGGSLQYAGGSLPQSYLLGTDGHIYNVNNAPASITYSGVYKGFSVNHSRWGVTETYGNVLSAPAQIYQQGYVVGRAAGSLTLSSPTTIFNGTIEAGVVNGAMQIAPDPSGVTDPFTLSQNEVATPGSLNIATVSGTFLAPSNTNVSFRNNAPAAGSLNEQIDAFLTGTTQFDGGAIDQFGLGGLTVITNGNIAIDTPLTLAPGAQISLLGSAVAIGANLTSPGGSVTAGQIYNAGGSQFTMEQANPPPRANATGDTVLAAGTSISTAGLWTNLMLTPDVTFTQAFISGGPVNLGSVNNLTLGLGSVIDTSAGGAITQNGKTSGGAGGAITLAAATPSEAINLPTGNLSLGGTLNATGFTTGGALTLSAPSFLITGATPAITHPSVTTLAPSLFAQGFSAYNLESTGSIAIAPGTALDVTEPTYEFTSASFQTPTGAAPATALTKILNPLYAVNNLYTSITQRQGASFSAAITLPATTDISTVPVLSIGKGAAVTVDPGQSISLEAPGQITINGALTAPGGAISAISDLNTLSPLFGDARAGTPSIWLGSGAMLNTSSQPVSFLSTAGALVSLAPGGGSITLGGLNSTALVIINQGANLLASGSAASDRVVASDTFLGGRTSATEGALIPVEGAGGAITLASQEAIYANGQMVAAPGGPEAAGGSLSISLEADQVMNANGFEATSRLFTITQHQKPSTLPAGLRPGITSAGLKLGVAQISADQITQGQFGSVTLYTRDAFIFKGDVTLAAPQSISLEEGFLTDSSPNGSVALHAPYVLLSGQTPDTLVDANPLAVISGFSTQTPRGSFTVKATTIDIASQVRFGGVLPAPDGGTEDLAGFATVNLNSSGDLRFVPPKSTLTSAQTYLVTTGNLNLTAREIYAMPAPSASTGFQTNSALIVAGYDPAGSGNDGSFNPKGVLTFRLARGTTPTAPDLVGGSLSFAAATIRQGGVIWQPLGQVTLGGEASAFFNIDNNALIPDPNTAIDFLPGSLTSVSAAGLTLPFGGTTDGVIYNVNGTAVTPSPAAGFGLGTVNNGVAPGVIAIAASSINVETGAVLDLQGGGALMGAGFISGQGGSSDVLTNPLLKVSSGGATQPSLAADPVYAIIAGPQPTQAVAYTASGAAGSLPALGATIIIPAGVPGLPAGQYTLLPAIYALMPGGYRVEFGGAASLTAPRVTALTNGSYAAAGYTALASTAVRGTLPVNLTITPGAVVQNYAQYDTENYSPFLIATTTSIGALRPVLPVDAGTLALNLPAISATKLANAGQVLFQAVPGGTGGILQISGAATGPSGTIPNFDIYGTKPKAHLPDGTVSLSAAQIDNFHAATIELGIAGAGNNANVNEVTLENGADLTASRVLITTAVNGVGVTLNGGITLNAGSEIDTVGQGTLPFDSTAFGPLNNGGASVLDVGNGYLSYSTLSSPVLAFGPVTVQDGAKIYTEGSIAISTQATVNIGVNASYGGKFLDLAVPEINIGDPQALGASAPSGLLLTQAVLQTLTQGIPALGVPAMQIMTLTAADSLNLYGTTALDLTGSNVQLVINTPAIYGFGSASDVATISANTIVWNGVYTPNPVNFGENVSAPPGITLANGPGSGSGALNLDAQTIIFGYSNLDLPLRDVALKRLTLGFSTVSLNASQEITANNQGSLTVYQSQNFGEQGIGGALNLNTPLLTTASQAQIGFTSGGGIDAAPLTGIGNASGLQAGGAGGEIDLTGAAISLANAVILPSGKLNLQAAGNTTLGSTSYISLAGLVTPLVDKTIYGFGGVLIMQSANGGITQQAGSVIDVSAVNNNAGSVTASATNAGAGQVALLGTLKGGSSGGYNSGAFTVQAQGLGDFAALNANLDAGQFFQSRSFDIKQGDLVIGNGVQAHHVDVSLDNGSLTVTGLIDASGGGGGSISLAASRNLTIASTAVLDAHGAVLQTDSYGVPIPSENAPSISLTSASGALTLAPGAQFNLASADGIARGDLELNVPRTGSAISGDANINAAEPVTIQGAATIAVNAFWTYHGLPYTDPNGTITGAPNALITQAYLDQINTGDTLPYMTKATANTGLRARLAGLRAYGADYHFRPGVQITSATPDGDLTVTGDLNLSGYRYGSNVIPGQYGSGEPGVLIIRAGGNLNVYGSITDGFFQPVNDAGTGFAQGWVVYGNTLSNGQGEPFGQNQTLPIDILVDAGTAFTVNTPLNFAVTVTGGTFAAGAVAPVTLTVSGDQTTSGDFIAASDIKDANGSLLFAKGQDVPAGSLIPDGSTIAPGGILPFALNVGQVTWPANTPFTISNFLPSGSQGVFLANNQELLAGSFIPGGSELVFDPSQPGLNTPTDAFGNPLSFPDFSSFPQTVNTRPIGADGSQGQLYGLAQPLPQGDLSWSIDLVSGADTKAASQAVVQTASALTAANDTGNLTLADTHYGLTFDNTSSPPGFVAVVPAFSVVRTGTGSLSLIAGGSVNENSAYGVYTAGAQSAPILDAQGNNPYNLPQGWATPTGLFDASNAGLAALAANYQANYPTGGGNVLIAAQGNLNGFISTAFSPVNTEFATTSITDTNAVGAWLWRQGGVGQPGAWWIEYGALSAGGTAFDSQFNSDVIVQYTGFQGIGTLGGGNLTVNAGGNASGLNLVVASNGRVKEGGTLVQNGGGAMSVTIGGAINFYPAGDVSAQGLVVNDFSGLISDLRGNTELNVGSIGTIVPQFGLVAAGDLRALPPLASEVATISEGIDLMPGDSTFTINARGDLVLDGVGNPGIVQNMANSTPVNFPQAGLVSLPNGGNTDFSLWTSTSGINLFSAGGDVAPVGSNLAITNQLSNTSQNATGPYYPPNLSAISQNGNIYLGSTATELTPSPIGQLQLLAAGSVIGSASGTSLISLSGAALSTVATPFNPGITVSDPSLFTPYTNHNPNSSTFGLLIDFGPDTPTGPLHAGDTQPALVYAGNGDILDVEFGQFIPASTVSTQLVLAAKPFDIYAGRDIVNSGNNNGTISPDTFLNLTGNDVTSITAGRDIIESSFDIAGPGNLTVQAGRNLNEQGSGVMESLGPVFDINPANRNSGSGISVLAGVGAQGPDYTGFANLFLNPASTLSLENASAIITANDASLYSWLQTNYGYAGPQSGAYAYFLTLPETSRDIFLRSLYFEELNASGLEFNDSTSVRFHSYLRGRDAIAALFPATNAAGQALSYNGDITMFGASGIHTDFGGAIETLTPGGQTIIGVEAANPPSSAGFITQGSGDIDVYSLNSVLLGESRVLTTFGGNILIWSAQGDINAGRGTKTSIDFTPLQRVYDNYGNVSLSPTVPSSGAGIATLNPITEVPPGNINLIAPLGTIDAGEAGIRGSGNLNVAALHVLNAANIQVKGATSGITTVSAPNIGALTNAASAAGAAAQNAENSAAKPRQGPPPSIWIVEIVGYGGGDNGGTETPPKKQKSKHSA
jgi:hypothetical protein